MIGSLIKKIVGSKNKRELKKIQPLIDQINQLEPKISPLSDDQLRAKTPEFRERIGRGESIEEILHEAFAVVRETAKRTLGERHYDVQLIGGIVLHRGKIAEMATGEGKTLVSSLPAYLNALEGKGVHIVTVNDYLAKRDRDWMGAIYRFLGLSVGVIVHELNDKERKEAYRSDITYGTNNEFGFDYLRDNMVVDLSQTAQRPDTPHQYAIVDEVDSILIDEARTPLIISGPAEETEEIYRTFARLVPRLSPDTVYVVDVKHRAVSLTDDGASKAEKALGIRNIYDPENFRLTRFLDAALRAHALFHHHHHHVVKDGEVIIVDEFTGRLMYG